MLGENNMIKKINLTKNSQLAFLIKINNKLNFQCFAKTISL